MATVLPVLQDGFARNVAYLRISLTDRCNYRCQYCMPDAGVDVVPKAEVLSFDEIVRVVRLFQRVGVRHVRLTGGEPTVRRDLVTLVAQLRALGLEDVALTTNGERLAELAQPLRDAGLHRLNVSIDSLRAERFTTITRRGELARVLAGLEAARAAGFTQTKLNVVAMGGVNDDEFPALCEFAWANDFVPRFIELMPMSDGALFGRTAFCTAADIRARITTAFGELRATDNAIGVGPARYWRVLGGAFAGHRVGIIGAVTEPFCETCNRVRLSATGQLHTCLALDDATDLRHALRSNATDDHVATLIGAAVQRKKIGHTFTSCGTGGPKKHMVAIGG